LEVALNTISHKPAIGSLGNFFSEKSWLKLVEKSSVKFDFFSSSENVSCNGVM
jgi:hypothetical protein